MARAWSLNPFVFLRTPNKVASVCDRSKSDPGESPVFLLLERRRRCAELWYQEGLYYFDDDEEMAVGLFKLSASLGNQQAQRDLSECYFYGTGVEKNAQLAHLWGSQATVNKVDKKAILKRTFTF
jgi:hypothetical protein